MELPEAEMRLEGDARVRRHKMNRPPRFLRDFGVFSVTIERAAELVVRDMWFAGEIDVKAPSDFSDAWIQRFCQFSLSI